MGAGRHPRAVTPTSANFYGYLHLNYGGMQGDYRIKFVWGQPIGMDWAPDGVTWQTCGDARQLGNTDHYFETHGGYAAIEAIPHHEDNYLSVEVGNGFYLVHGIPDEYQVGQGDPTFGSFLPYGGKLRWIGMNGWTSLEVYPVNSSSVAVTKYPRNFGAPHPGIPSAFVVSGSLTNLPTDQTNTYELNTDGQSLGWTLTASREDPSLPPRLADAMAVIPAVYVNEMGPQQPVQELDIEMMELYQQLNDQARTFTTNGKLTLNNQAGQYTGLVGRKSLFLYGSNDNGATIYSIFRGIFNYGKPGVEYVTRDGGARSFVQVPISDFSCKMVNCIGSEPIMDGFCDYTAGRAFAEMGRIHPQFLQRLPLYVPPNATADAPYGPAGYDCPYFILPRGTGRNAKYRYTPEMTAWAGATGLVTELGYVEPATGRIAPFYCGFTQDNYGDSQWLWEGYDPSQLMAQAFFSDLNLPGTIGIRNVFRVISDVSEMRTGVTFEGLDARTNVLNYVHLEQPDDIKALIGWPMDWVERHGSWSVLEDLVRKANNALVQCGTPDQLLLFDAAYYLPWIQAGMLVIVSCTNPSFTGTGPYVIIGKLDRVGNDVDGKPIMQTSLVCRTLYSYV